MPFSPPPTTPRVSTSTTPFFSFKFKPAKQVPTGLGKFPVLVRRFGQFKTVGYGRTPGEAVAIGKSITGSTLGATFKVPGLKPSKIKGYKTKVSKKEGQVFIELPKYRLSTGTEKQEIQMFKEKKKRSVKGGRKKKK